MREVEVKAKISDLELTLEKLKELGCEFGQEISQKDIIYIKNGLTLVGKKERNFIALRTRSQEEKTLFTLKKSQENELDSIEIEFEIGDAEKMKLVLEMLGYNEIVRVNKIRKKCKYNKYEICLDEVDGLGKFIEVEEIIKDNGDSLRVQKELWNFLSSIGVKEEDRVVNGYDVLMYKELNS